MRKITLLLSILSLLISCTISTQQICHGNQDQVSVFNSDNGFKIDGLQAPYQNFLLQLEFEDYVSYKNFYYLTLNKMIPGGNQTVIKFLYHDEQINYFYPFYHIQGQSHGFQYAPNKINENYKFKTISLYINKDLTQLYYGYLFETKDTGPWNLDFINGSLYIEQGSTTNVKAAKLYKDITESQKNCLIQTLPPQFQTCQKGYLYVNNQCVNSQICNQNPQSYYRVFMTGKSVYNPVLRQYNVTFEANGVQNPKCVEGYIQNTGYDKTIIQYSGSILNPSFIINKTQNTKNQKQFYYTLYNRNSVVLQFTVQVDFTIPPPPNSQQSQSVRFKYGDKNTKNKLNNAEEEQIEDENQQQPALRYLLENQNSQGQPLQLYKKYSIQTASPFDYHTEIVLFKNYKFQKPLGDGSYKPYSDIFAQLQVNKDYLQDGSQLVFQNAYVNWKKAEIVSMDITYEGWLNLTIRPKGQVDNGYAQLTIDYKFIYNY